jgi:hypothetical protein
MKRLNKFILLLFACIYLLLSAGMPLFVAHCNCTDSDRISLYVNNGSCEKSIPDHSCCGEHADTAGSCHQGVSHACGCDETEQFLVKLPIHFGQSFIFKTSFHPLQLFVSGFKTDLEETFAQPDTKIFFGEFVPPLPSFFGRSLLNLIHQRKIDILL